ncbi:hypothetical protein, partial [Salmonella enterica]|uniref:hypothetical protein n=2 Tax=Pseudomonadota TaxID=1224 RepID=UPI0022B6A6A2|nr:hypothetical protein [Salmonella enterica]
MGAAMTADQAAARQASVQSMQADLLRELEYAHVIIRNMLGMMSVSQKFALVERNARDGVDGEGATRAHERATVIARAGGTVR